MCEMDGIITHRPRDLTDGDLTEHWRTGRGVRTSLSIRLNASSFLVGSWLVMSSMTTMVLRLCLASKERALFGTGGVAEFQAP